MRTHQVSISTAIASVAAVQPVTSTHPAQTRAPSANRSSNSHGRPRRTRAISDSGPPVTVPPRLPPSTEPGSSGTVPAGAWLTSAYASPRPAAVPSLV